MSSRGVNPGGGQTKNILLKVILLGDGGVGKSCLMNRFVSNRFDNHSFHTIGVEFLNKEMTIDGQLYTLQIWDTAGQERFRSLRTPFYRGSDICLLTFALDDAASFKNLSTWREEFLYYADVKGNFPFALLGNKMDMEEREVTEEDALSWCAENGNLPFVQTSAKESTNVEEAFKAAVQRWISLDSKFEKPQNGNTVTLSSRRDTAASNDPRPCCDFQ